MHAQKIQYAKKPAPDHNINGLLLGALHNTAFGVTMADARNDDLPLIYSNPAFETMTGYSDHEISGQNCRFLQGPDTNQESVEKIRHAIRARKAVTCVLLNYRKDGKPFWNRFQLSPVLDEKNNLSAYLGMQVDISDDVNQQRAEVERQKLETLGRMAGGVAHEINNALQPIRLYTETLQARDDQFHPQTEQCLQGIYDSVLFAADVVDQFLSFARHGRPEIREHDAVTVVTAAIEFASGCLPTSETISCSELAISPQAKNAAVEIDQTSLFQVVLNLFTNALHAIGEKGNIDLSLDLAHPNQGLTKFIVLTVSDDGRGMEETTKARIFEPFFSTKSPDQGTGLGLSTIYRIVKDWGGFIEVDSTLEQGTQVRIYIPAHTEE